MPRQFAGRYAIERQIGQGATAIVYLAHDLVSGQTVAIKVLRHNLTGSRVEDSFAREIRRTSRLEHPQILKVLAHGNDEGQLFFVVPYMEGGTLRRRMDHEKQLMIADAVAIARTIAEALDYAHRQKLVHRDVKPENILFTAGQPCLGDFGIARALEKGLGEPSSTSGVVRGTVAYMSPEQASAGSKIDGRSDIYSLGCVLYEMLAGVPTFTGPTPEAILAVRFTHPPRELSVYRPTVPAELEALVHRALQFSPADRFKTAGEFARALNAVPTEPEVRRTPRSVTSPQPAAISTQPSRLSTLVRRWRKQAIVVAALTSVVGATAYQWSKQASDRFRARDWILVADFDGPRDDPGLANAVRELTTAELNQSSFVSTLPRSQLNATMRLAGVPETTRVSPQLARELAFRSAIRGVLVGSVNRLGRDNYSVVLHVVDADDGADIWSDAGAATDSTLITTVQRLARRMRGALGERRTQIEAALPLDQIATPSFAAYRRYVEALRMQTRGDARGSNRLLREALALDTAFASAWFTMGWNYVNDRMLDSARWAFRQALARRDRMSELQRYRLEADVAYSIEYDVPAAIRAYDLYLARSPRSWAVHNNRGNYLLALGRYEDALRAFNRAVDAHPFGPKRAQIQVANQAATLIALGRVGDAERAARDLSGPFAVYLRLMLAAAAGRWDDCDTVGMTAATDPSSPGWLRAQAAAVAASGQVARGAVLSADGTLSQAADGASPDVARWLFRGRLLVALASGRAVPALPNPLAADTGLAGSVTIGLAAAVRGDTVAAWASLDRIRRASPGELRRLGSGPQLIEAWIHARRGAWPAAAQLIGAPAARGEHDTSVLDRVGSLSLRWLAAEAYARTGRLESAIQMLELTIRPERMPGNEFAQRGLVVPFAHRRLAQWYAAGGDEKEAAKHWQAFLSSFSRPDPDLAPLVAEAHLALRRLGQRS